MEHLLSLKVVFLGYLRQLNQADRAFLSRFLEETNVTTEVVRDFAQLIGNTMEEAIGHIHQIKTKGNREKDKGEDQAEHSGTG